VICSHCHRKLTRPPVMVGGGMFGPTCARNLFGTKPRTAKSEVKRDGLTRELWEEVRA
jgi:hypothetical protein